MMLPGGVASRGRWLVESHLFTVVLGVASLLGMGIAFVLITIEQPLLATVAVLAVPGAVLLARSPDFVPPAVAFALYMNAPAVAVTHHGVPFVVAAAVPLVLCVPIMRDLLRGERVVITPTLLMLLAFLLVQFVGALFAIYPEESLTTLATYATEGLLLYVLVSNAIRTPAALKSVIWALILAGALMGAISAHQQLTGSFDSEYGGFSVIRGIPMELGGDGEGQPRLSGPIGEKNRFAQIMAMLVPLALFQGMAARSRWLASLAWSSLLLILVGFALAFSRGAAVGLGLMFAVMVVMGYVRFRHIAVATVGLVAMLMIVPGYAQRVGSLFEVAQALTGSAGAQNADSATRGRITEMIAAGMVFADHPIVGVGPGMNPHHYLEYGRQAGGRVKAKTRRSHSLYAGLAAEHGLLGLLAYAAMLFFAFRDLIRARRRWLGEHPELAAIATGLILLLVVYLTTSLFLHAAYVRYFWLCMGVVGAASHLRVESPQLDLVSWLWRRMAPQGA